MTWLAKLWSSLQRFVRSSKADRELDEEIQFHVAMQTEANVAAGMGPEEARHAALRSFGGIDQAKEECRDIRPFAFFETLWQDISYGVRMLLKNPGFTLVAVLTLALGIGATTSIFSAVDIILLHPLPYKNSSRLVAIFSANPRFGGFPRMADSLADALELRSQAQSFDQSACYASSRMNSSGQDEPEQVAATEISSEFFDLLGDRAALGRFFAPSEYVPGNGTFAVLSHAFWSSHFGQKKDVIGKTLTFNETVYTVVGVASAGFDFPDVIGPAGNAKTQIWLPIRPHTDEPNNVHYASTRPVSMLARLRPGVNVRGAEVELQTIAARIRKGASPYEQDWSLHAVDFNESVVGDLKSSLLILLGAVALVLLISCANVANLLLSRGWHRQKEIAIRIALGAGTKRIIRQLLTESVLLAVIGGAIGLLLAFYGITAFRSFAPLDTPRVDELHPSGIMLWFTLATVAVSGILFGLAPAFHASQLNPGLSLKEGGNPSIHRNRMRGAIVVLQVALALPLVVGSALLLESLYKMTSVSIGMRTDHLLTMHLAIPPSRFNDRPRVQNLVQQILDKIRELPMVESVAATDAPPLRAAGLASRVRVEGNEQTSQGVGDVHFTAVTPDYFGTSGIPILKGRAFSDQDRFGAPLVAIINEKIAHLLWQNREPIGTHVSFQPVGPPVWLTVIGVVGDTRDAGLDSISRPELYTPYFQRSFPGTNLVVRTRPSPGEVAAAVERKIWSMDKNLPITSIATAEDAVERSIAQPRFRALLLMTFAAIGFVLAMIGIYGVVSYSVAHRTHEIGIRRALGATQGNILKLIVSQGLRLALLGIGIGLLASFALTRLMAHLLFGVTATDPITFVTVALLVIMVAALASYIPARRAARVDPMVALRTE